MTERTRPIPAHAGLWRDLGCALALFAVAAGYFVLARRFRASALADAVGPAGLPLIYAQVLGALALVIGLAALLRWRSARAPEDPAPRQEAVGPRAGVQLRRAAGALAIGVAYVVALPLIGYPFAIALTIAAMAVYQGERAGLRLAAIACGGAVVLYLLFDVVLGIALPAPWR